MNEWCNKLLFTLFSLLSLSLTPLNQVILFHPPVSPQKDQVRLMIYFPSDSSSGGGREPIQLMLFISKTGVSSVFMSLVSGTQSLTWGCLTRGTTLIPAHLPEQALASFWKGCLAVGINSVITSTILGAHYSFLHVNFWFVPWIFFLKESKVWPKVLACASGAGTVCCGTCFWKQAPPAPAALPGSLLVGYRVWYRWVWGLPEANHPTMEKAQQKSLPTVITPHQWCEWWVTVL